MFFAEMIFETSGRNVRRFDILIPGIVANLAAENSEEGAGNVTELPDGGGPSVVNRNALQAFERFWHPDGWHFVVVFNDRMCSLLSGVPAKIGREWN